MKGEDCGFLHVFDPARLPVCRNLIKFGECKEPDCPFKHSLEDVKVCTLCLTSFLCSMFSSSLVDHDPARLPVCSSLVLGVQGAKLPMSMESTDMLRSAEH